MDYLDLTTDLPQRCRKLLQDTLPTAREQQVDVTFLLMVASLGFVTPYELLKVDSDSDKARDSGRGSNPTPNDFKGILEEAFISSSFAASPEKSPLPTLLPEPYAPKDWRYGIVTHDELTKRPQSDGVGRFQEPELWLGWETQLLTDKTMAPATEIHKTSSGLPKTFAILRIIRNALAHAHIRTAAADQTIDTIIFLSRIDYKDPRKGFYYVGVTPDDFLAFLLNWFDYLDTQSVKDIIRDQPFKPAPEAPAA